MPETTGNHLIEVIAMQICSELRKQLSAGVHDQTLAALYAPDKAPAALAQARERCMHVIQGYQTTFSRGDDAPVMLVSGPGRTELGGNHTDHQRGRVLCGSIDLDALACAGPNGLDCIRVYSEGYQMVTVDLARREPVPEEANSTASLIRGVAAGIAARDFPLQGFDAYVTSSVLVGSGLSSSAAYEILLGSILNQLCCGGQLDAIQLAQIGQYAENIYFGKPCGLLDQAACSVGGAVAIDFADPANPIVERVDFDFTQSGHALCIVDTGSCHADLTDDYASIPREMGAVAAQLGKQFLREVPEEQFRAQLPALRRACGDRAVLRAMHFYADDRRAAQEAQALKTGDFGRFLSLVNESGLSSSLLLQNIWSPAAPQEQAVAVALTLGRELLGNTGAIRVHGGGFAGTIQAFVPNERLDGFRTGMEALLGKGMCHVLRIRPQGGCVVCA